MKMFCRRTQILLSILLGCIVFLAGCSGGGGVNNSVITLNPQPTATATIQMDATSVQLNGTANVSATFLDVNSLPIPGLQVSFSTTLGSFNPSTGLATTNTSGMATIQLLAGSTTGSGTVLASATVNGVKISKQISFSVVAPQAVLSTPQVGLATLAPGGSTGISVTLTDAKGNPFTTPVDVSFTSAFTVAGKAALTSPVTSVNGVASSTYTALAGAVGTDTITVSVGASSVTTTVTVVGPSASSISFVSATPKNVTLKGMGGVGGSETSILVFKVLDSNGQPMAGQAVDFALNTAVGGLSLTSPSASSAADGTVTTIVQAGTIATPIRVTASINNSSPLIATQSDQLVVSTGVPAQDGFSISISNFNSESFNHDGVTVAVTARLSDHFHNPVPDGTAISFTTNGGAIQPSCTTIAGVCSVNWISQNPRPDGTAGSLLARPTILAYAVGEESFLDANGNGVADSGTCSAISIPGIGQAQQCGEFIDTPEAFRDDNFNGKRELGETFIDFNSNILFDGPDGIYNGILRPSAVTGPKSKHVFYNSQIVMSTDAALISVNPDPIVGPGEFDVTVTDRNGNTMAAGTTVTITVPFGTVTGFTSYTVPQNTGHGQILPVFVAAGTSPAAQAGTVRIDVKSPGGLTTSAFVTISGNF